MRNTIIAAAAIALLATSSAHALTYAGSLTVGSTTATYTIDTDGTFGALAAANIVNVSATISSATQTQSFTHNNFLSVSGVSTIASATQILFDTSVAGAFSAGSIYGVFTVICFTGTGNSCAGEPAGAILLGADFSNDYELTTGNASFVLATIATVPEPATWSLMIGGFGLAGLAVRRRRATVAVAAYT